MTLHRLGALGALAILPAAAQVYSDAPISPDAEAEMSQHRHALAEAVRVSPDGSVIYTHAWSGYVVTGSTGSVTDVKGSWIVPAATCNPPNSTYSAFWVGIDGLALPKKPNGTVEQIGTESDCVPHPEVNCLQAPCYYAWYQFVPSQQNEQPIQGFSIQPGDKIFAEVSFSGGQFTVTITDEQTGQSFSANQPPGFSGALQSEAEWIAEAPSIDNVPGPLADFGTVLYGYDNSGVPPTCDATVLVSTGTKTAPIGRFATASQITMVSSTGTILALPSALTTDGTSFSVAFQPPLTTLLSFDSTNGANPYYAGLIQATDGNLYGTTLSGGAYGYGTVFKISPGGTTPTTLYSFCKQSACADGANPQTGLIQATDGNLYGTTYGGGAYGAGTVFKISPSGTTTPTTLYTFCKQSGCTDGASPHAGLVQATNGYLYGTTISGGMYGYGTIFKISPSGTTKPPTVYSFCQQSGCPDGANPYAGLIQATDGNLYGTTQYGGFPAVPIGDGAGTIFRISPGGTTPTTLYSFCAQTGCGYGPLGTLVQATNGDLYGTTWGGGLYGAGTVFKMPLSGTTTSPTLYSFCSQGTYPECTDGYYPQAALVQATDGNLYGTTYGGGTGSQGDGGGTIFKITPSNGTLTTVYNFCSQSGCTDGANPDSGLIQTTDGSIYGTTAYGGANGDYGTVFNLSSGLGPFVETRPTSGNVGADIKILGTNLTGATSVTFNGTATTFEVVSPSEILALVPAGATTGKVHVVTPSGRTLSSYLSFRVLPTTVYSDFGRNMSFSSTVGWCVSGQSSPDCGNPTPRWIAAPFTPAGDYNLTQVDLALGYSSGTNGAVVEIVNSAGGLPGTTVLESWNPSNLPCSTCVPLVSLASTGGVMLLAGTQYWLVAQGSAADTLDFWWGNTLGLTGSLLSLDNGASWIIPGNGDLTAFEVLGIAAP